MDLIGKKVKHSIFGEGVIINQSASYILVRFSALTGEKKFIYPSCFQSFLKLLDDATASVITAVIEETEKAETEKREKARQEAEARDFERRYFALPIK